MDYEDYYNATKDFLLNRQQLKFIFDINKQSKKEILFLPHILIGGVLMQPMPALSESIIAAIGTQVGEIKFGGQQFLLHGFAGGTSIAQREAVSEYKLTKEHFLADITLNFAKGEIWLGYHIYDFDEIARDIDQHIRYYIDDVPEIHQIIMNTLKQALSK